MLCDACLVLPLLSPYLKLSAAAGVVVLVAGVAFVAPALHDVW
jgi:hypothetical protein